MVNEISSLRLTGRTRLAIDRIRSLDFAALLVLPDESDRMDSVNTQKGLAKGN